MLHRERNLASLDRLPDDRDMKVGDVAVTRVLIRPPAGQVKTLSGTSSTYWIRMVKKSGRLHDHLR